MFCSAVSISESEEGRRKISLQPEASKEGRIRCQAAAKIVELKKTTFCDHDGGVL